MLGPLAITRGEVPLALPASRKVRALAAYLALAPHPVTRPRLCEMLWEVPNDPRGELRWCLSKIRGVLDEPGRQRVKTVGDTVSLDLEDCFVDAVEIVRVTQAGIDGLGPARLRELAALFAGDLLDGLEVDRSPGFGGWLNAQRRRLRAARAAILEQLAQSMLAQSMPAEAGELVECLEKWIEAAPFEHRAHEALLSTLARNGRIREGEEHVATTVRLFEDEGVDWAPVREAWRRVRGRPRVGPRPPEPGSTEAASPRPAAPDATAVAARGRASVAVMPFAERTAGGERGGLADGLAHDVISRLAKLRSLFVIAQGSVFALDERRVGPAEAVRFLNVDFLVSGSVRRHGSRVTVAVELVETRTARIVWAEVFDETLDDTLLVLDEIGNRIVASIAGEIEVAERNRAVLKPPNSLNAWEAYHRGLWHVYRYSEADNSRARHFFEMAVRLDPTFARAHAGLSFTHFQSAFRRWTEREPAIDLAFAAAEQSLIVDDRDPAAHWAMGRALWLRGRHDQSLVELGTAVELSPSFAHGHYTMAFVNAQSGDPQAAIGSADHSRHLSPFDPMLFAILTTRAMALVRLGRFEEAADWAVRGAARPNAFSHIRAIAACCLALAGRLDESQAAGASIRKIDPGYRVGDLLATFQFAPDAEAQFREGARRLGMG